MPHYAGPRRLGDVAEADGSDPSTREPAGGGTHRAGPRRTTADPCDGRAHQVALTELGREVLDAERRRRAALVTDALAEWPDADRADLTRFLVRLGASLGQRAATTERTPA